MGMALQCDICGKVYTAYNTRKNPEKPSGIMFINVDDKGKYWTNVGMFLCPECMNEIVNYIEKLKEK